jgi:DUF4097 and DUF4098 domain-containing protein YvlB
MKEANSLPGATMMTKMLSRRSLVLLGVLLMSCSNAEAGKAKGSFEQNLTIDESIQLDVATGSGDITVRDGQAGQVEVIGRIEVSRGLFRRNAEEAEDLVRRFEAEPPVRLSDGRLKVGHIRDRAFQQNVSISYEITVPAETRVKSHTGSGSQDLSGVKGPVEVSTGSGSLRLTDIGGAVDARTGSGSIRADRIGGSFHARTGSGSVKLVQNAPGDVDVSSGSGGSELSVIGGALRVHSGSGRIKVEGNQDGPWRLDTGSGSIQIHLPESAAFELDAKSSSGDIKVDHPVTVQGRLDKDRVKGAVRGGGSLLKVRTGSGDIRIR